MHNRVYDFLLKENTLYDFSMLSKRSFYYFKKELLLFQKGVSSHALVNLVQNIKKSLDNRTNVCRVFIDLQKAFDTVNHNILLDKLYHYRVRGPGHLWFKSYLTDRKQMVLVKSIDLNLNTIICGVLQGSIQGPLLSLLYIND